MQDYEPNSHPSPEWAFFQASRWDLRWHSFSDTLAVIEILKSDARFKRPLVWQHNGLIDFISLSISAGQVIHHCVRLESEVFASLVLVSHLLDSKKNRTIITPSSSSESPHGVG